jgi:hypothetical protein
MITAATLSKGAFIISTNDGAHFFPCTKIKGFPSNRVFVS